MALDVLSASVPIVNVNRTPTVEFMIKWEQLAATLLTIPALSTQVEVSAVLDVLGTNFGDLIYRGLTQWGVLPPGSAGQVLTISGGAPTWASAGAGSLAGLTDVLLTAPANNDVLTYESGTTKWKNKPVPPPSLALASLTDVLISGLANGQVLTYVAGASKWENSPIPAQALSGLTDVNVTEGAGIDGKLLSWNNATSKWVAVSAGGGTLASLTDVNVTEGAGIDGDVLTWNNATSKWIAAAGGGGGHFPIFIPPLVADFSTSHMNTGMSVANAAGSPGLKGLLAHNDGTSSDNFISALLNSTSGTWRITARIRQSNLYVADGWDAAGLLCGKSGKYFYAMISNSGGAGNFFGVFPIRANDLNGSINTIGSFITLTMEPEFLHLDYDGTNINVSVSIDGEHLQTIYSEAAATFLGGAPDQFGLGFSGGGGHVLNYFYEHYHVGSNSGVLYS